MSILGGHRGSVCGFLVFWLQITMMPLLYFITVFVIICVSLLCFSDEVEDHYADRTYVCVWNCFRITDSLASKTGLK